MVGFKRYQDDDHIKWMRKKKENLMIKRLVTQC